MTIEVLSLTFLSDHAVLTDNDTNWDGEGSRFTKPDWTPARSKNAVSHTMDKRVRVRLVLEIGPPGAPAKTGDIRGVGPDGMVFEQEGVVLAPGRLEIVLSSDRKLARKIQALDFVIHWHAVGVDETISPPATENTMFVTMGTPRTPSDMPGITTKRMRKAVELAGAAHSLDPHKIVEHVIETWSSFNLHNPYTENPWLLANDDRDPKGNLIGSDCQTIVRYTNGVIKMVGCPGKAEPIVVWAKVPTPTHGQENLWPTPNMTYPLQRWSDFHPPDPEKAAWIAVLLDYEDELNKFEACLRFTYPERGPKRKKKYYPGGVLKTLDNADEVIQVFKKMVWAAGRDVVGVIYDYEHGRPGPEGGIA